MAGNIFEIYSSNRTFLYIETLINKKWPRDYISNSTNRYMTYIDVKVHVHWKQKGVSNVYFARQSYLGGFFLELGDPGACPQASCAIMLPVYDDYYV